MLSRVIQTWLGTSKGTSLSECPDGKIRLAFSPNGDGKQDSIQYRTVLYRNINNLTASVYTADDTDYRFPIWQSSTIREGRKNYYSGQSDNPKSYLLEDTYWDGRDSKGEKLEDGLYTYVEKEKLSGNP